MSSSSAAVSNTVSTVVSTPSPAPAGNQSVPDAAAVATTRSCFARCVSRFNGVIDTLANTGATTFRQLQVNEQSSTIRKVIHMAVLILSSIVVVPAVFIYDFLSGLAIKGYNAIRPRSTVPPVVSQTPAAPASAGSSAASTTSSASSTSSAGSTATSKPAAPATPPADGSDTDN